MPREEKEEVLNLENLNVENLNLKEEKENLKLDVEEDKFKYK